MNERMLDFSRNQDQTEYKLTAFGTEYVEAMPDKKKMAAVKRKYARKESQPPQEK